MGRGGRGVGTPGNKKKLAGKHENGGQNGHSDGQHTKNNWPGGLTNQEPLG